MADPKKKIREFIADKKLKDLEWRFSIATSNNMVDQYSECFLQFKITTFDRNKTEDVLHMELNVSQFYELFSEIEKIKNLIDFYKK